MSDDTPRPESHDETQPVRPAGATPLPEPAPVAASTEPPPAGPSATDPPAARRGFRERLRAWRGSRGGDRAYGLAALIASALAGVIVGGLGYAAVDAIDHDGPRDRDGWVQRDDARGPGDRGPGDRDGMPPGPRGVPGQLPPTTSPEDQGGTAS